MLTDELPGWLLERGLAGATQGSPAAVLGISMGAFGALPLCPGARRPRRGRGPESRAVRHLGDASVRHAFRDRDDWAANEPLRHLPALRGTALGVWCGSEDPFLPVACTLARGAPAAAEHFGPGDHSMTYWRRVMPQVMTFLAPHLQ